MKPTTRQSIKPNSTRRPPEKSSTLDQVAAPTTVAESTQTAADSENQKDSVMHNVDPTAASVTWTLNGEIATTHEIIEIFRAAWAKRDADAEEWKKKHDAKDAEVQKVNAELAETQQLLELAHSHLELERMCVDSFERIIEKDKQAKANSASTFSLGTQTE